MENLEQLKAPFYKYLNNELSEEAARAFLEHIQSGRDREIFLQLIQESMDTPFSDQLLNRPELMALLNQSFTKIMDTIGKEPEQRTLKLWPRIAVGIAAVLAVIAFGIYFFNDKNTTEQHQLMAGQEVIPGKIGATLTLASGKKIRLTDVADGEIAKEQGISVVKTADGQLVYEIAEGSGDPDKMNTLSTSRGETYILILPDKSKVWMNAASSLTYSTNLSKHGRKVKLEGEAYFQVTEDKSNPFIVESRGQQVEVLGTYFNVNAYADEDRITTTLLKGSVRVSGKTGAKILKPGEQSAVNENSISISPVDTERAVAWKNNKFLFENDDIRYIMRMIARWYNVDVVYTGEMPTEKFGGGVSRFDNVQQVLKILESTGGVHFKIEGRKILVSK